MFQRQLHDRVEALQVGLLVHRGVDGAGVDRWHTGSPTSQTRRRLALQVLLGDELGDRVAVALSTDIMNLTVLCLRTTRRSCCTPERHGRRGADLDEVDTGLANTGFAPSRRGWMFPCPEWR